MSPYRVLANSKESGKRLLAAMLSIDKKTQRRRIFIIEKTIPVLWNATFDEIKQLAHRMTSRNTSLICAEYTIYKDELQYKYIVQEKHFDSVRTLEGSHYIQSDCLVAAMQDYVTKEGLNILQTI